MADTWMHDTPYNARYAKPFDLLWHRKFDGPQLFRGNGRKGTSCCYLFDGTLIMTKQMEQDAGWHILLGGKCCKTSADTHLAVSNIDDAHGSADTNQNISRFRHFCRRIRFYRRMFEKQIAEIDLPLMEFHPIGSIQGFTGRRLSHVDI